MELKSESVSFLGHVISKEGLKIDPKKVSAILDMPPPTNLEELRRLNGMLNYLSKFLPNLSTVMAPLTNLTKKDVEFNWSSSQANAFQEVKRLVTEAPVLAFYDPNEELVLENDASEMGVGSFISQKGKPIAYASCSFTESEKRCLANMEREFYAILFGLTHFRQYTYGREVKVVTDHKPLETITKKPLSKAPRRLQSMMLRAMEYDYHVVYQPGKSLLISDTLSRAPLKETVGMKPSFSVNNVIFRPEVKAKTLDSIRKETSEDASLQGVMQTIRNGWPNEKKSLSKHLTPISRTAMN